MKVQEIYLESNSKRYILIDGEGIPVIPVVKYLKYLDTTDRSSNTQKTYCYALKQYFIFLEQNNLDYKTIKLEDLVEFIAWLRNPYKDLKATPLQPAKARKTESTINLILTAITGFYNYLYRNEEMDIAVADIVMKQIFTGDTGSIKIYSTM
jgi:integrase/recombinase XerD